ncbi:MAG: HAMP domain-containing protein [Anaerolineaceae bacterium]|nr:HAMP domain-containing protein [Anaerolineaceae bacterium]
MRISLTVKWILTLLVSSLIGVALVGFFAYWTTTREFDRFRNEAAEQEFLDDVTSYYEAQGSWDGISTYLQRSSSDRDRHDDFSRLMYAVLSLDGVILSEAGPYKPGDMPHAESIDSQIPLVVDNETVGYALSAAPPAGLSPQEQEYLGNTNRALVAGIIGASSVAVLVGLLLSRQFLYPLIELTEAITAMKSGDLQQQVRVTTNDELGQLAETFNQMSSELHRASQLRKQMTADIAHDLRTPLHVMSGYIEAMRDGALPPTPERFDAMNNEANLLKRLVEDLRTLSLADSNALKLNYQSVNVGDLLQQVKGTFAPLAEQEGITLQSDVQSDLPEVQIDRERMVQVLTNLLSNALRYTSADGTITLFASKAPQGVELAIQDTGSGIPADQLENIFERFYRVDESRNESSGESGLGLAIVKSIVEAHDGTVRASSKVGEGTTFTILLPA